MQCELCKQEITNEMVTVVPEINTYNIFDDSLGLVPLYDRKYMHKRCAEYYHKKTYNNWLEVNKHNPYFVENESLLPAHFMFNHQQCKFCDKETKKFAVYEMNGRSVISALSHIDWEDTVNFKNKLYLPLCERHWAENYHSFSKETFLDTYHYVGDYIPDFSNLKKASDAEEYMNGMSDNSLSK